MGRWLACTNRLPCNQCVAAYTPSWWDKPEVAAKKAGGPPCGDCRPPLHPDNAVAHDIYLRTCNQLIVAPMGGALDINILAVKAMMDLDGLDNETQRETMAQVQALARVVIGEQRRAKQASSEAGK